MKVKIEINNELTEPYAILVTNAITPEIQNTIDILEQKNKSYFKGEKDDKIYLIKPEEIIIVRVEKERVFAITNDNEFEIKLRLYDVESKLMNNGFVRVSKSAIVCIDKISHLETSFGSGMCIFFQGGLKEYISRHYLKGFKEYIGIGGK